MSRIFNNYIEYINSLNNKNKSSSKNFYIIVEYEKEKKDINIDLENIIVNNLNEKYFKIKECLSRCGNSVCNIESKKDLMKIFYSK